MVGDVVVANRNRNVAERSQRLSERNLQLWVKLGRKLDVRAESAFPVITDIVTYGRAA